MTESDAPTGESLRRGSVSRSIVLFCVALTATVGFLVYVGALWNEFVWDDPIVLNQQLQAFHSIKDIFFPPPKIPQFGHLYYRPLIIVTYVIDRALWGDTSFGFHFPVVVFHAINCVFVFLLGRRLFGSSPAATLAALAGGLLFATHPIHTESVYWMAGRSDTLATLCLLPAMLAYLAWKRNRASWKFLILSTLLFFTGCLAKESALGLLFLVGAADFLGIGERSPDPERPPAQPRSENTASAAREKSRKQAAKGGRGNPPRPERSAPLAPDSLPGRVMQSLPGWIALGGASGVYYMLRVSALASEATPLRQQNPDLLASIGNLTRAVGFYVEKIVLPINLDVFVKEMPHPGLSLALGVVGLALAAAIALLAWKRGEMLVTFFIAWFFGAIAPSLSIAFFQISETPVAERYLYLPSVGFCLLAGYLLFVKLPGMLPSSEKTLALASGGAVLAVSALYGAGTIDRGRVWRTDFDFWKDAVAKSPDEGLPHLHLGLAYANKSQDDLAEQEYNTALKVRYGSEGRSIVLNNLGMLYMVRDKYDKADEYFQQSIQTRQDYATPHYGLGMTAFRRGDAARTRGATPEALRWFGESEKWLRRSIELNPQYVKALGMMGQLLHLLGRDDEAMNFLNRLFQLVNTGREYEFALKVRNGIQQRRSREGAGGVAPGPDTPGSPGSTSPPARTGSSTR